MIVTEEEAKTKWCPEVRVTVDGENRSSEWDGQDSNVPTPPEFCCIGSACMAWRWQHYDDDQLNAGKCMEYVIIPTDDPAPEGDHWTVDLDPDNQTPGHTTYQRPDIPRGYCGKAGKPDRY